MIAANEIIWPIASSTVDHVIDHVTLLRDHVTFPSRTAVGRGRAWLRFGVMQKKLGDHFRTMTDNKTKLRYLPAPPQNVLVQLAANLI